MKVCIINTLLLLSVWNLAAQRSSLHATSAKRAFSSNVRGISASKIIGETIVLSRTSGDITALPTNRPITLDTRLPYDMTVYPNPEGDILSLKLEGTVNQPIRVQLVDASGNLMTGWSFELDRPGFIRRSTQELPSGVYYLRLSYADGSHASSIPILRVI